MVARDGFCLENPSGHHAADTGCSEYFFAVVVSIQAYCLKIGVTLCAGGNADY